MLQIQFLLILDQIQDPKTDIAGDDQAEYDAATNSIKIRVGTGADALSGGEVIASPEGADSTVVKFRVHCGG